MVQKLGIFWQSLLPFLYSCHGYLGQTNQRAPFWFHSLIKWWAQHKGNYGYQHGNAWNSKAPTPAHVVLDVNHNGQSTKRSEAHAEKVPIEDVPLSWCHTTFGHVNLVCWKGHNTWSNATWSNRCEEEGDVEYPQLWGCGFLAISLCWAWWGTKLWQYSWYSDANQSLYQEQYSLSKN